MRPRRRPPPRSSPNQPKSRHWALGLGTLQLPRLYAILDVELTRARGLDPLAVLSHWIDDGVRLVQLRAKTLATGPLVDLTDAAVRMTRAAGARLIVNDRADVARMSGADGVHLGQDDLGPGDAREVLGPVSLIGLSTHNEDQIRAAIGEPIDYVAIGPVFSTQTKARPDPVVGLEGVRLARQLADAPGLPVVAIGGITLETASKVINAGADAVAVISDLVGVEGHERVRAYLDVLGI